MHKPTLALGLLLSAVAAEYTTTLLLVGFDSQTAVGSVIAADATATTYSLACGASVDPNDCGIPPSFTITQGPSTMHYEFPADEEGNPAEVAGCKITTDHGVCSGSVITTSSYTGDDTISYSNYGKETVTYSNYGMSIGAQVVTITAGVAPGATGSSNSIASTSATASVQAEQTASSSRSSSTGSESSTGSSTGSGSSNGSSTGSRSSTGSSSSSKVSTGGVPMITTHAQWVIGGAAAAVAIAII